MDKVIYLDFAGAHPPLSEVVDAHADLCRRHVANPHASSHVSERSRRDVDQASRRVLDVLGIPEHEATVIWTSGGTEADNLGVIGYARGTGRVGHVLVDSGAHAALLEPCRQLPVLLSGWSGKEIPLESDGALRLAGIETRDIQPTLVAVGHTNNETGFITDLVRLRQWMTANAPNAALMVDGMQSFTKCHIPWRAAQIDMLTVSGRKIGGPAQIGALIYRSGVSPAPIMYGGEQQKGLRPGSLDVVGVCEFALAAELASSKAAETGKWVCELNAACRRELAQLGTPVTVLSTADASPFILCFAIPGYEGAIIMRMLADMGIVVATGSACSAESGRTSHVLQAMGLSSDIARCVLRVSFGAESTMDDVRHLGTALKEALAQY